MSAIEGAVSVGAPSAGMIGAGPSVGGIGSPVSAELGISTGIGFDTGSPSFSGLGRSDTGFAKIPGFRDFSPSISSVPEGPVRGNVFKDMREFAPSLGSVPEGPVTIDIFSSGTKTEKPSINETPVVPSIFRETSPFQITLPTNEGTAPFSDEFISISAFKEPEVPILPDARIDVEETMESFVFSEAKYVDAPAEAVHDAVEDLKTNDPLTYMQLKSDLALVQNIVDIATEEVDPETSTAISNAAINAAVERSGLIQALQQTEPVQETEAEPSADPMNANVQAIMKAVKPPAEELVEPKQVKPKKEYFVHDEANEARRSETVRAIKQAFEEEIDPETGKVKGKAVVDILPAEPTANEISEIVLKEGGRDDGSEAQRRNHLSLLEFSTEEEALAANDKLIAENNAVTDEEARERATEAEAEKVRNGTKPTLAETQIFPLAA